MDIRFTYLKTPLNKYTFKAPKIRQWVEQYVEGKVLNLFAGQVKLDCDEIRNDLREDMPADYHTDAFKLVRSWRGDKFDTILLDPPYAMRKSMEMYEGAMVSSFNKVKNALSPILHNNGIVITFGYHSNVMGHKRGFKQEHILLMSHGGAIHDTIAVIERKIIKDFWE